MQRKADYIKDFLYNIDKVFSILKKQPLKYSMVDKQKNIGRLCLRTSIGLLWKPLIWQYFNCRKPRDANHFCSQLTKAKHFTVQ